jgi:prepilin-type N-terminal cleavage/methylation domain-containing protein/prepilin-type processing-associated H-X9-DG protein
MVSRRPGSAFTLIELFVVVAIIGLLAAMILPALSGAKARARTIACLSNKRQLGLAWLMYAQDNNDWLVLNSIGEGVTFSYWQGTAMYSWVIDFMSWDTGDDNTNYTALTWEITSPLAPYLAHSPRPFKCPADTYLSAGQRAAGWAERVRSVSMNMFVGDGMDGGWNASKGDAGDLGLYVIYKRLADFRKLGPSQVWVITDEHPDSIGNGAFYLWPTSPSTGAGWAELPASYHQGGCTLVFGDGHTSNQSLFSAGAPLCR